MIFAIKEINQRHDLLPHLKLGYHICDTCGHIPAALRRFLVLVNGQPERGSTAITAKENTSLGCAAIKRTPVVIGDASSGVTRALLRSLGSFHIPLVRLPDCVAEHLCKDYVNYLSVFAVL